MAASIPFEVTSFVGRRAELAEVKRLLSRTRLLTLTGTGGVGKTRLALRAAADLRRFFGGGATAVELAGLEDAALLADAVASALGLRNDAVRWQLGALGEQIGARRMLLVLDNCEHLADAVAILADTLLRGCPELRILVTSRQPLRVAGETTFRVPSLSLPSTDMPAEPATGYEAVRLFLDRAAQAAPGFAPSAADVAAIVGICRRLDGIPLAIELAAVRVRTLAPDEILGRLDDRFALLSLGSAAAPRRHHTLRAAIDWSYELLEASERVAWRRLSVFSSGFELDAAEAVLTAVDGEHVDGPGGFAVSAPPDRVAAPDTAARAVPGRASLAAVELVAGLVEKSVVAFDSAGGRPRYRLGETLRQFGRERLAESGEALGARRRHRDWYAELVAVAERSWLVRDNLAWLDRIERELDNVRAALEFCLDVPGEADAGLAMASDLWMYWSARGHVREGRHWLVALLAADPRPTPARAAGLMTVGVLCRVQADYAAAADALSESWRLAEATGDSERAGLAMAELAIVEAELGRTDAALELLEDAVRRSRARGDRTHRSYVEYRATVLNAAGRPDEATTMLEQALELCREAGDRWRQGWALRALAAAAWQRGDRGAARASIRESLAIAAELNDVRAIVACLDVASWLEAERAASLAGQLFGAVDAGWSSLGLAPPASWRGPREAARAAVRACLEDRRFEAAVHEGASLALPRVVSLVFAGAEVRGRTLETLAPRSATATERGAQAPLAAANPHDPSGNPALSRREMEVAQLVADGLTNKEIAARLFLSVRTVDTHVDNILRKLGLSSRVQLAVWQREAVGRGAAIA